MIVGIDNCGYDSHVRQYKMKLDLMKICQKNNESGNEKVSHIMNGSLKKKKKKIWLQQC
jgi:hypothetical protein